MAESKWEGLYELDLILLLGKKIVEMHGKRKAKGKKVKCISGSDFIVQAFHRWIKSEQRSRKGNHS